MARNFPADDTIYVDLGDITTARFEQLKTWSFLLFCRLANINAWKRMCGKWAADPADQFGITWNNLNRLQVYYNGTLALQTANLYSANVWYMLVVTNDGTGNTNGSSLDVFTLDGTSVVSSLLTHGADAADLTNPILIGRNGLTDGFQMNGDMAYVCYTDFVVSARDMQDYILNPVMTAARFKPSGVQFFLPLNGSSPEVDWSGNANNGTVNGSPSIVDTPPFSTFFSFDPGIDLGGGATPLEGGDSEDVATTVETLPVPSLRNAASATSSGTRLEIDSLAGATETKWEISGDSTFTHTTTKTSGAYGSVLSSGIDYIDIWLPPYHSYLVRVKQKVNGSWKDWGKFKSFKSRDPVNSFEKYSILNANTVTIPA